MNEPKLIDIATHVDDRGFLRQLPETFGFGVKRIYILGNFSKDTVRAYHFHAFEWKAYYVVSGSAKFVSFYQNSGEPQSFIISDKRPQLLVIPPQYAHGWKALEEGTILLGLSDKTLKESELDDTRFNWAMKGEEIWQVKAR